MASLSKCTHPGKKTIEEVAQFLGVSPKNKIKTLALMIDSEHERETPKPRKIRVAPRPVVVLMRGDHQLNEAKLSTALAAKRRGRCRKKKSAAFQVSRWISRAAGNHGRKNC